MAFADELLNNASERITYVTVEPKALLSVVSYTQIGSNSYYIPWSYKVTSVFGLTEHGSIPADTDTNKWFYDTSTQRLYVTSSFVGGPFFFNNSFFTYVLGFTTGKGEYLPYDLSSGTNIDFEARLQSPPRITEDIGDALYGVTSITASPLEIINTDRKYNSLFTDKTTWKDSKVIMWVSVNGETSKIFTGLAGLITNQSGVLSVSVSPYISKLKATNSFGITTEKSTCTSGTFVGAVFSETDNGKSIPFYNYQSRQDLVSCGAAGWWTYYGGSLPPPINTIKNPDSEMPINAKYSTLESNSENNSFIIGYVPSSYSIPTSSYGFSYGMAVDVGEGFQWINPEFDIDGNFTKFEDTLMIKVTVSNSSVPIGTYMSIQGVGGYGTLYGTVVGKNSSHVWLLTKRKENFGAYGSSFVAGTVDVSNTPSIAIETDRGIFPLLPQYYTISFVTVGSVKRIMLTISSWSDIKFAYQLSAVNGDSIRLHKYIVPSANTVNSSTAIEELVEYAGLSCTDLTADTTTKGVYKIPTSDGGTETYLDTLQNLLKGVGGFLRSTSTEALELCYLTTPSSPAYIITEEDILKNTFNASIVYDDTYSVSYIRNPITKASAYSKPAKLSEFYGIERRLDLNTIVSAPVGNARTTFVRGLYNSRYTQYNFRVSHKFLNVKVGDIVSLTHPDVLGSSTTVLGMITKYAKSETSVSITIADLQTTII